MKILLPQKRNLDLLIILLVMSAAGFASFLTQIAISAFRFDGLDLTNWSLAIAIVVMAIALVTITVYGYIRFNDRVASIISETVDALETGVVRFDQKGQMVQFNPASAIILPELCFESYEDEYIGTYKKFLSYTFDHSLNVQDQSRLVNETHENTSSLLFKEIIVTPQRRTVMVQFYQREGNEIVAVLTDISILKRSADRTAVLNEENSLMIKAIEAGGNGVLISKMENDGPKIIYSNEIFRHATRLHKNEITHRPFYDLMNSMFPVQGEQIRAGFVEAQKNGKSENIWLSLMEESRKEKWFSLSLLFFKDTGGHEFLVCFFSDQTQARLEEARMFQMQKMDAVAQLAGGIAHDFNNVLSVIDGYSKLMQLGMERGEDVSQFFEKVKAGVNRGMEITSRLLTFGVCRMTEKARIDICDHVRDMEQLVQPMLDSKTKIIFTVQDEACYVDMSPDSVAQVILSLVANACEAMEGGGDIVISLNEADRAQLLGSYHKVDPVQKYICLQVIDSGAGMKEDTQKRIFEPFYTTKDVALHPGLGLSLIYAIVRDADGFIDIKSAPELGTIVSILLPEKEAPEKSSVKHVEPMPEYSDFKNKTMLIVDDVVEVLNIEAELMSEVGFNVLKAVGPREAIKLTEQYEGDIDYFLLDVSMPEISGIELKKILQTIKPLARFILISGYPSPLDTQTNEISKEPIISKPLKMEEFRRHIDGTGGEGNWIIANKLNRNGQYAKQEKSEY